MQFQRASPNQVLVLAPIEEMREAAWHALSNARIMSPIIDMEKNLVSGSQGDGILTAARVATARFQARADGTLVSFESKPVLGGRDIGARGREKKLANSFERILSAGYSPSSNHEQPQVPFGSAPIADPFSTGKVGPIMTGHPVYGSVLAAKRGMTLLGYGIFSLICCQILVPITFIYGIIALRDYKRQGDPGDKWFVIAGMAISGLALLAFMSLFILNLVSP
jgi:hypothetical protein